MKFELYSRVALTKDFPDDGLKAGDIATVVDYHPGMDVRKDGYSLEVFNALGETIAVIGVSESDIEVLHSDEVFHKRQLQLA